MILLAICFSIGITNSSAKQNYRRLHKSQKTDPNDKVSRTVIDAVTTEKASTFNFTIMPIASRSSAIQRYRDLHEIRKNNLNDEIPITSTKIIQKINNMNGIIADVNKKNKNSNNWDSLFFYFYRKIIIGIIQTRLHSKYDYIYIILEITTISYLITINLYKLVGVARRSRQ